MTVSISSPKSSKPVNFPGAAADGTGLYTVKGTLTDTSPDQLSDSIDGTLTDEQTGDVYIPTINAFSHRKEKDAVGWSLEFSIPDGIPGGHTLYMYAYDTSTGSGCQATYQEQGASVGGEAAEAGGSVWITVNATPPTAEVQDIKVTVNHPPNTRGFVFLILWKNKTSAPSVESHKLLNSETATSTDHTFRRIKKSDWKFVSVNVVAHGSDQKLTVTPVVLESPRKSGNRVKV